MVIYHHVKKLNRNMMYFRLAKMTNLDFVIGEH
jgi:hypothetical protein